jgi:hypothetical protein
MTVPVTLTLFAALGTLFAALGTLPRSRSTPKPEIYSFTRPRRYLTRPGMPNHIGDHPDQFGGFPTG